MTQARRTSEEGFCLACFGDVAGPRGRRNEITPGRRGAGKESWTMSQHNQHQSDLQAKIAIQLRFHVGD